VCIQCSENNRAISFDETNSESYVRLISKEDEMGGACGTHGGGEGCVQHFDWET
jgi:hypothetical protein